MGRSNFSIQFSPELIQQLVGETDSSKNAPSLGLFPPPLPQAPLQPAPFFQEHEHGDASEKHEVDEPRADKIEERKQVEEQKPKPPAKEEQPKPSAKEEQPKPAKEEKVKSPAKEEKPKSPAKEEKLKSPAKEEKPNPPAKEEKPRSPAKEEEPAEVARDLQPLMKVLEKTEKHGQELQKKSIEEFDVMKKRAEELQQKHLTSNSPPHEQPCLAEKEECIKCYKSKDPIRCKLEADAYVRCAATAFKSTVS